MQVEYKRAPDGSLHAFILIEDMFRWRDWKIFNPSWRKDAAKTCIVKESSKDLDIFSNRKDSIKVDVQRMSLNEFNSLQSDKMPIKKWSESMDEKKQNFLLIVLIIPPTKKPEQYFSRITPVEEYSIKSYMICSEYVFGYIKPGSSDSNYYIRHILCRALSTSCLRWFMPSQTFKLDYKKAAKMDESDSSSILKYLVAFLAVSAVGYGLYRQFGTSQTESTTTEQRLCKSADDKSCTIPTSVCLADDTSPFCKDWNASNCSSTQSGACDTLFKSYKPPQPVLKETVKEAIKETVKEVPNETVQGIQLPGAKSHLEKAKSAFSDVTKAVVDATYNVFGWDKSCLPYVLDDSGTTVTVSTLEGLNTFKSTVNNSTEPVDVSAVSEIEQTESDETVNERTIKLLNECKLYSNATSLSTPQRFKKGRKGKQSIWVNETQKEEKERIAKAKAEEEQRVKKLDDDIKAAINAGYKTTADEKIIAQMNPTHIRDFCNKLAQQELSHCHDLLIIMNPDVTVSIASFEGLTLFENLLKYGTRTTTEKQTKHIEPLLELRQEVPIQKFVFEYKTMMNNCEVKMAQQQQQKQSTTQLETPVQYKYNFDRLMWQKIMAKN